MDHFTGNASELTFEEQYVLARSKLWTPELDKLLRKWKNNIEARQRGHYELAHSWGKFHYVIGIPSAMLTTIYTTGSLATFRNCDVCNGTVGNGCESNEWIRLSMGILGIVAMIATATQTFLNSQAIAESHKTAADNYEALCFNIESLLVIPGPLRGDPAAVLSQIRKEYDESVKKSPSLSEKYRTGLNYETLPQQGKQRQPALSLPTLKPDDVGFAARDQMIAKEGADLLDDLLDTPEDDVTASVESFNAELRIRNNFDSDDDEKEVCLGFDLDQVTPLNNTSTALAIANLSAQRDKQIQSSLMHALQFEMGRLGESTARMPTSQNIKAHVPRKSSPKFTSQVFTPRATLGTSGPLRQSDSLKQGDSPKQRESLQQSGALRRSGAKTPLKVSSQTEKDNSECIKTTSKENELEEVVVKSDSSSI